MDLLGSLLWGQHSQTEIPPKRKRKNPLRLWTVLHEVLQTPFDALRSTGVLVTSHDMNGEDYPSTKSTEFADRVVMDVLKL